MSTLQRLLRTIESSGPIPFEQFQAEALYGADGFYGGDTIRSTKSGDFLTSPEVSPLFGMMLGRFFAAERDRTGGAARTLVEVAGGSGSLLRPMLETAEVADVWTVEVNGPAREALASIVGEERSVADVDQLPDQIAGVVVANELLDNLPVALAVRADSSWRELWVGAERGALTLVDAPVRDAVFAWADQFGLPCPDGGIVEVQMAASEWVRNMVDRLERGAVVLIDYGDVTENLEPRRSDGTMRTYRAHTKGGHPLDDPGSSDITVDVNFTAMIAAAEGAGAEVTLLRQDEFLSELGLRTHLRDLRLAGLAAAKNGEPRKQLELRSEEREAATLLAQRGLGEFQVLIARK